MASIRELTKRPLSLCPETATSDSPRKQSRAETAAQNALQQSLSPSKDLPPLVVSSVYPSQSLDAEGVLLEKLSPLITLLSADEKATLESHPMDLTQKITFILQSILKSHSISRFSAEEISSIASKSLCGTSANKFYSLLLMNLWVEIESSSMHPNLQEAELLLFIGSRIENNTTKSNAFDHISHTYFCRNRWIEYLMIAKEIPDPHRRSNAILGFKRLSGDSGFLFENVATSLLSSSQSPAQTIVLIDCLVGAIEEERRNKGDMNPGDLFEKPIMHILEKEMTSKRQEVLHLLLDSMERQTSLSHEVLYLKKALNNDYTLSSEEFHKLSSELQSLMFLIAAIYENGSFLETLTKLGVSKSLVEFVDAQQDSNMSFSIFMAKSIQDPIEKSNALHILIKNYTKNSPKQALTLGMEISDLAKKYEAIMIVYHTLETPSDIFYKILTEFQDPNQRDEIFQTILSAMESHGVLPEELPWIKKAFNNDSEFSEEAFLQLPQELKIQLYFIANVLGHEALIKKLNALGMKEDPLFVPSPSTFAINVDNMAAKSALQDFLGNLRKEGLLLTSDEFNERDSSLYLEKSDQIGRIQGAQFIERLALENGLKRIKVPKKLIVMNPGVSSLSLEFHPSLELMPTKEHLKVYAELITPVDRKLTLEEGVEFLIILEKTGYKDLVGNNYFIAEDGIYFIDTEFKDFRPKTTSLEALIFIAELLDPKDQDAFSAILDERKTLYSEGKEAREAPHRLYEKALENPYKRLLTAYEFNFPLDLL